MIENIMQMIAVHSGIPSALRLMKVAQKKKKDKIKIVFMCQLAQVWSCIESIYDVAKNDEKIEAVILAIPNNWEGGKADTEAYDYCLKKGYAVINAYDEETKRFLDLKSLNPDYVFIPRPYDNYLPNEYRSKQISKYAKVCYVCYCYLAEGGYILKTCYNKYFTTNCYFVFADNPSTYEYCKKNHPISSLFGIRKIVQTTFPRFDLLEKWKNCEPEHWKMKRANVKKRIIWTPRWTTDESLGGTSFFKYKTFFMEFAEKHPDVELMVRPHPLAFPNFVKEGLMTEEEVVEYKEYCTNAKNVQLDERKEYLDSFASADILVADMSGVIFDFLAMDKPIVYCNYEQELNAANEKLIEGFYVPHSTEELNAILEAFIGGVDSKKEIRQRITKEVLGELDGNAGAAIVNMIKKDAQHK